MSDGVDAAAWLEKIAGCSEPGPGVTRLPWTEPHAAALRQIAGWMQAAGLEVSRDAAGTLIGRTPGRAEAPALLLGSHQDSVREGGRFDGIMGVALACLAVRRLHDEGVALPFALEVLAFADEEGVRFPTALIGPRALAGRFDPEVLEMRDTDGVSMAEAMRAFGAVPEEIAGLARDPAQVVGYLEAHIEQGPVLESADAPVGVVTAICGIARYGLRFSGETGHAGTVPMGERRDALVAAGRFVADVSEAAEGFAESRATVGQLSVAPGVVNAIPSEVTLTLELRAPEDATRDALEARARALAEAAAAACGVTVEMTRTYDQPAVACDPGLRAALGDGMAAAGLGALELPSGATHDASAMADLCPVGMLFLRCAGGVSHRPDEFAAPEDMAQAVAVLAEAVKAVAARG
ncbi:M20 family metallo-hydrolase [Roseivivax sp. GX 12232]|uniref:M20 family metallo-hydrolase n=1 Tax=Roseivivax sp. GX 12232 TaxID=2900547 RepID=UPI001E43388C|nr:M20 family metallo-hydrolase [Roseivivax sp. GX 12232]MCE0505239.1 M20 family metallo-hydrolase [Roseivivax sp. GX 12232]